MDIKGGTKSLVRKTRHDLHISTTHTIETKPKKKKFEIDKVEMIGSRKPETSYTHTQEIKNDNDIAY